MDSERSDIRRTILYEIRETETSYCNKLNDAIEYVMKPLQSLTILKQTDIQAIFSNLETILQVNRRFLRELESIDPNEIGYRMKEYIPYFNIYRMYISNKANADKILRQCKKKIPAFAKFLEESEIKTNGIRLESILIEPVQRLPRYKMLLERLLKYTDQTHPDYQRIQSCVVNISEVNRKNNDGVAAKENQIKVLDVQQRLDSFPEDLVQPHRTFVREGYLTKQCKRALKRYYFLLFSDILIYGIKKGSRVQFKRKIELRRVENKNHVVLQYGGRPAFIIVGKPKSFVVIADTEEEKREWLNDFDKCCQSIVDRRRKLRAATGADSSGDEGPAHDAAPFWSTDDSSDSCMRCQKRFWALNRRHHCRYCGRLVCDACSKGRMHVPWKKGLQRVCDKCGLLLAKRDAERRLSASPRRKDHERSNDNEYDDDDNAEDTKVDRSETTRRNLFEDRVPFGSRPLPPAPTKVEDAKTTATTRRRKGPHRPPPLAPKSMNVPSSVVIDNDDDDDDDDSRGRMLESRRSVQLRRSLSNRVLAAARKSSKKRRSQGSDSKTTVAAAVSSSTAAKLFDVGTAESGGGDDDNNGDDDVKGERTSTVDRSDRGDRRRRASSNEQSRQQKKTLKALKYLARRSPERRRPGRRPPPIPS